jgi:IS5 family transposase
MLHLGDLGRPEGVRVGDVPGLGRDVVRRVTAYDYPRCRRACRKRGIVPRIARRGIESSERLGRYRWVVERTLSWIARCCRLVVRYERRDDVHLAFLILACAVIGFRFLQRFCWAVLVRRLLLGQLVD